MERKWGSQNHPKIHQNYIQKPSKFRPGGTNIEVQRHQNRGPEGSGAGLETSWAILGHPGRLWERLGPCWRRLGGVLEASWAVLGRKRWPTWLQVGSQNAAKINKKSIQNSINFLMPLGGVIFRFSRNFWTQNRAMLARKCIQKSILS